MRRLGIFYEHIHVTDGQPVVILESKILSDVVSRWESGQRFGGRFVSDCGDGTWSGAYMDQSSEFHHKEGMTESIAYRFVLGYRIGRVPQTSRYKGYQPRYRVGGRDSESL